MMKRSISKVWHEPMQRWLFVGTLVIATLAVPAIAVVSRVMVDQPTVVRGGGSLSYSLVETKDTSDPAPVEATSGGPAACAPSLIGSDSMLLKQCPLKK